MIIYWSNCQVATLIRMRSECKTIADIALAMGRTEKAIQDKIYKIRKNGGHVSSVRGKKSLDLDTSDRRKCRYCGEFFNSEHKFNKICLTCLRLDVFACGY